MSSFRNHRVIIASLFLPTTPVLGPEPIDLPIVRSPKEPTNTHTRQPSANVPLKSIVDDLKDKTTSRLGSPAARSPAIEAVNPFTKLTRFAIDEPLTRTDNAAGARAIRRKQSRSSSRRAASTARTPISPSLSSDTNHIPISETWHMEPNLNCNGGLKNAIDSVGDRLKNKVWVGTLGTQTDAFPQELRNHIEKTLSAERDSVPVWVADDVFKGCYDEFCHQVLWPCLHYAVPDAPKTKLFFESASYAQYLAVNRLFASRIADLYKEGDIIFINDYHLLLLPSLLRLDPRIPASAPIGFFMHVAFPSSEIFRCLSMRAELLKGMLGADLVGFQTGSYARHWRQTVSRILSFEALPRGIQIPEGEAITLAELERVVGPKSTLVNKTGGHHHHHHHHHHHQHKSKGSTSATGSPRGGEDVRDGVVERGRLVDVGVFPMGIDVRQLHIKRRDPEVAEWVQILRQRYAGYKLLVGRDKLDEIQGVKQKLQAFEVFLSTYAHTAGAGAGAGSGTQPSAFSSTPNPSHPPPSPSHTSPPGPSTTKTNETGTQAKQQQQQPQRLTSPVVLIQIALPTSSANEAAASSLISDLISRINARFSTLTYTPIVFLRMEELTMGMYLALMEVGDVFCVMSLREGMALRTHEYVECQGGKVGGAGAGGGSLGGVRDGRGHHRAHFDGHEPNQIEGQETQGQGQEAPAPAPAPGAGRPGVLVLSEFTGSYSYSGFRSCIAVNPWDARGTARAMYDALTMGDEEARGRWEDLHNHVTTQTAQTFVTSFLNRCVRANTEHQHNAVGFLEDGDRELGGDAGGDHDGPGGSNAGPILLRAPGGNGGGNGNGTNVNVLVNRFRHSRKRMILVDFEGTLWKRDLRKEAVLRLGSSSSSPSSSEDGNANPLPEEVERALVLLERLAEDRRNEVWLLSGLKVEGVLERVARRVPRVGIVAENGCFIKTRGSGNGNGSGEWYNMVANINMTWKSACLEILNYFTERTPGSFIEEREASMVWRYWTSPSASTSSTSTTTTVATSNTDSAPTSDANASANADSASISSTSSLSSTSSTSSSTSSTSTSSTSTSSQSQSQSSPERQWAQRQAAEAQNHIFDSLGERYGLRIIPGRNSFLVLPTNVSRSSAVGEILHPGGVARRGPGGGGGGGVGGHAMSPSVSDAFVSRSPTSGSSPPHIHTNTNTNTNTRAAAHPYSSHSSHNHFGHHGSGHGGYNTSHGHGHGHVHGPEDVDADFLLAVSSDEQLLRRLNEFEGAETVSTSGKGTDAKWRVVCEESAGVLGCFVGV